MQANGLVINQSCGPRYAEIVNLLSLSLDHRILMIITIKSLTTGKVKCGVNKFLWDWVSQNLLNCNHVKCVCLGKYSNKSKVSRWSGWSQSVWRWSWNIKDTLGFFFFCILHCLWKCIQNGNKQKSENLLNVCDESLVCTTSHPLPNRSGKSYGHI